MSGQVLGRMRERQRDSQVFGTSSVSRTPSHCQHAYTGGGSLTYRLVGAEAAGADGHLVPLGVDAVVAAGTTMRQEHEAW